MDRCVVFTAHFTTLEQTSSRCSVQKGQKVHSVILYVAQTTRAGPAFIIWALQDTRSCLDLSFSLCNQSDKVHVYCMGGWGVDGRSGIACLLWARKALWVGGPRNAADQSQAGEAAMLCCQATGRRKRWGAADWLGGGGGGGGEVWVFVSVEGELFQLMILLIPGELPLKGSSRPNRLSLRQLHFQDFSIFPTILSDLSFIFLHMFTMD